MLNSEKRERMKKDLDRRVRKLEGKLSTDKKKPLTLSKFCELSDREKQGEKIDWERYDFSGLEKLLEGIK